MRIIALILIVLALLLSNATAMNPPPPQYNGDQTGESRAGGLPLFEVPLLEPMFHTPPPFQSGTNTEDTPPPRQPSPPPQDNSVELPDPNEHKKAKTSGKPKHVSASKQKPVSDSKPPPPPTGDSPPDQATDGESVNETKPKQAAVPTEEKQASNTNQKKKKTQGSIVESSEKNTSLEEYLNKKYLNLARELTEEQTKSDNKLSPQEFRKAVVCQLVQEFDSLDVKVSVSPCGNFLLFKYKETSTRWDVKFILESRGSVFAFCDEQKQWLLTEQTPPRSPEVLHPQFHTGIIETQDQVHTSHIESTQHSIASVISEEASAKVFDVVSKLDGIGSKAKCILPDSPHYNKYCEMVQASRCCINNALLNASVEKEKLTGKKSPVVIISTISSLVLDREIVDWIVQSLLIGLKIERQQKLHEVVSQVKTHCIHMKEVCEDLKQKNKSTADDEAMKDAVTKEKKKSKKSDGSAGEPADKKASEPAYKKANVKTLIDKQQIVAILFDIYAMRFLDTILELYAHTKVSSSSGVVVFNLECLCAGNSTEVFEGPNHQELASMSSITSTMFLGVSTSEMPFIPAHIFSLPPSCPFDIPSFWRLKKCQILEMMRDKERVIEGHITEEEFFCRHKPIQGTNIFSPEGVMVHAQGTVLKWKTRIYYLASKLTIENAILSFVGNKQCQKYFPILKVSETILLLTEPLMDGTVPVLHFFDCVSAIFRYVIASIESSDITQAATSGMHTIPVPICAAVQKAPEPKKFAILANQGTILKEITDLFYTILTHSYKKSPEMEKILVKIVMEMVSHDMSREYVLGYFTIDRTGRNMRVFTSVALANERRFHMGFPEAAQQMCSLLANTLSSDISN